MNGGLSTFFESTNEFMTSEVKEDNILYQSKNRKGGEKNKVVFYGDHIWTPMYEPYFDEMVEWASQNTRDLDTLDNGVRSKLLEKLKHENDFKICLAHIIGVDSAGHTYNSQNPNIERKLKDSDRLIRDVIDAMDDETTLIVFGDHGMTEDGNHGGGSDLELRTVFFAYQKKPFPFYDTYMRHESEFFEMEHDLKLADIAASISVLLDQPFPYSNLGILYPLLAPHSSIEKLYA